MKVWFAGRGAPGDAYALSPHAYFSNSRALMQQTLAIFYRNTSNLHWLLLNSAFASLIWSNARPGRVAQAGVQKKPSFRTGAHTLMWCQCSLREVAARARARKIPGYCLSLRLPFSQPRLPRLRASLPLPTLDEAHCNRRSEKRRKKLTEGEKEEERRRRRSYKHNKSQSILPD